MARKKITRQRIDDNGNVLSSKPYRIIDWEIVDEYLKAQCTCASIARILGVDPDTLRDACMREKLVKWKEYSDSMKHTGLNVLKKAQFDTAIKSNNPQMQIWLGKQYLDQKDKQDVTSNNKDVGTSAPVITFEFKKSEEQ